MARGKKAGPKEREQNAEEEEEEEEEEAAVEPDVEEIPSLFPFGLPSIPQLVRQIGIKGEKKRPRGGKKVPKKDPKEEDDEASESDYDEPQTVIAHGRTVGSATSDDKRLHQSPAMARFLNSQSGLGGNWEGVRGLGEGAEGLASLWQRRDDNGTVVQVNTSCACQD